MLEWLKWILAEKEMVELERWRVEWRSLRQWLAEFPEVAATLDHMKAEVCGEASMTVSDLRERLRSRARCLDQATDTIDGVSTRPISDAEKAAVVRASMLNLGRLLPVGMEVRFGRADGDPLPRMTVTTPDGETTEYAFTTHQPIYLVPAVEIDDPKTMLRVGAN